MFECRYNSRDSAPSFTSLTQMSMDRDSSVSDGASMFGTDPTTAFIAYPNCCYSTSASFTFTDFFHLLDNFYFHSNSSHLLYSHILLTLEFVVCSMPSDESPSMSFCTQKLFTTNRANDLYNHRLFVVTICRNYSQYFLYVIFV